MSETEQQREIKVGKIVFPLCRMGDGRWMSWWMDGTKRNQLTATTLEKLKAKLERVAINIRSGNLDAAGLEPSDHRAYIAAQAALKPHGIAVDLAAREYAAAKEIIGTHVSILDACRFYQRHAGVDIVEKRLADVITEFLKTKDSEGLSVDYQRMTRQDLTRFSDLHGTRLMSEIVAADVERFLETVGRKVKGGFKPAGPKRRNQVRNTLVTLFSFARDRHYLIPDRQTQAEVVKRRKTVSPESPVFSPAQLQKVLLWTKEEEPDWLPWIVIGAFTGIRTGAILRLDWSAFRWEHNRIQIGASASKVGRRFLATIRPCLAAWLADWRNAQGPVCKKKRVEDFTERLERKGGIDWHKNVLRSSYISYRFAQCGNAQVVANETNTSAKKVLEDYQEITTLTGELVTPELAEKWFSIMPVSNGKIIPMPAAETA